MVNVKALSWMVLALLCAFGAVAGASADAPPLADVESTAPVDAIASAADGVEDVAMTSPAEGSLLPNDSEPVLSWLPPYCLDQAHCESLCAPFGGLCVRHFCWCD